MSLRSSLGLVRGLGSAKSGTHHWWMQRLTAVALIPLSLWFVSALVCVAGADYSAAIAWLRSPLTATLLVLLIASVFYHAQLGLQVVIEDYVHHEAVKVTVQVLVKFGCLFLGLLAALAVLKVFFGA